MNFKVKTIPNFEREAKRLSKKYPSFKSDLSPVIESLSSEPYQGSPLGNKCYKLRIAITSKAKGKSGGARLITYIHIIETTVYLLSIYDKSEKENISQKELLDLVNQSQL